MTQPDDPGIFGSDHIREIDIRPLLMWGCYAFGVITGLGLGMLIRSVLSGAF